MASLYSLENPVFSSYVFHSTLVLLKMLSLTIVTSYKRRTRGSVRTPEDLSRIGENPEARKKAVLPMEDVERVSDVIIGSFITQM